MAGKAIWKRQGLLASVKEAHGWWASHAQTPAVSGCGWLDVGGGLEPLYEIRTCRSADGLIWELTSVTSLPNVRPDEAALGRPWVTDNKGDKRLWYSRRGLTFRGPGEGAYHLASRRLDAPGVAIGEVEMVVFDAPPSEGDFDAWVQAYCCVMPWEDTEAMFYNGNDFGRGGIGWSIRREVE